MDLPFHNRLAFTGEVPALFPPLNLRTTIDQCCRQRLTCDGAVTAQSLCGRFLPGSAYGAAAGSRLGGLTGSGAVRGLASSVGGAVGQLAGTLYGAATFYAKLGLRGTCGGAVIPTLRPATGVGIASGAVIPTLRPATGVGIASGHGHIPDRWRRRADSSRLPKYFVPQRVPRVPHSVSRSLSVLGPFLQVGWFQWDGEHRRTGWEMLFSVDHTGRVSTGSISLT